MRADRSHACQTLLPTKPRIGIHHMSTLDRCTALQVTESRLHHITKSLYMTLTKAIRCYTEAQRRDRYTRVPAPNPLALARAAAAPTRVSSDMPKESWVCAVRVKIAVRVQSAAHSEAHAPRRLHANLFAAHARPRHRSPPPLHAPWVLAACIWQVKRCAHLKLGHRDLLAVATRRLLD